MANHVTTNVELRNLNEAGIAKLKEIFSRIRPTDSERRYEWFGDLWVDGADGSPTYEETEQYSWTIDNIGPKWCHFDEIGDDYFRTISAWSYPQDGIEWLVQRIAEVCPEVVAVVTYEDEMPNFFGASIIDGDGVWDNVEWEYDELREVLHEDHPELLEHWDADEEEGDDEYNEMVWEHQWEELSNMQWSWLNEMLDVYKQD